MAKYKILILLLFVQKIAFTQEDSVQMVRKKKAMLNELIANKDFDDGNYQKAIELYSSVIELGYSNAYVYFKRGLCKEKLEKYEDAMPDFSKSLSLLDLDKIELKNDTFMNIAFPFHDKYIIDYENGDTIIDIYPPSDLKTSSIFFERGYAKMALSDYRGASKDMSNAFYISREYPSFLNWCICNLYLEKFKDVQKRCAGEIKNNTSKTTMELADLYYFKGMSNLGLKLKDNACNDFSKSGELGNTKSYDAIKENCK